MKFRFTYVVEFNGGASVSQVEAKDLQESVEKWFKQLEEKSQDMSFLGSEGLREMKAQISGREFEDGAILLEGLPDSWSLVFAIGTQRGYINIIKTEVK
ncbi:MAG: hypothetical protein JJ975_00435 [Bacteroidia bacterium]|nr:hypothetical protein [Bacteroidia bacterium]